jgi:hypothetical protein
MKRLVKLSNLVILALVTCCIEPIDFEVPPATSQLVVEGFISNEPGPYTVSIYRSRSLKDSQTAGRVPLSSAIVKMYSDAGEEVTLPEQTLGNYTTNAIRGVYGRSYWITIQTPKGTKFESEPEMIKPAGEIDAIRYEYEHRTKIVEGVERNDDRFNVFIDSRTQAESDNYVRWRVVGTYKIETRPDLITAANPTGFGRIPNPPPCSGYEVRNGALTRVGLCTCCICWVTNYETVPQVSDEQFVEGNQFQHVRVGTVPISPETFYDKYHVAVTQMSISKQAFNFFRVMKAQKEGVTSLFQPASGKLRGNLSTKEGDEEAIGLFWAAGVTTRSVYIDRNMVPVYPGALQEIMMECQVLKNSTATKPSFWQ